MCYSEAPEISTPVGQVGGGGGGGSLDGGGGAGAAALLPATAVA